MDHEVGTYGMEIDYCIMKEGMSILRGWKSVPGMNSNEREMERGYNSAFTNMWHGNRLLYPEGRNVHTKRTEIRIGMNSRERKIERGYYSVFT
nr:hypothetical protein [Tanacetum cinerariifolium]